MSPNSALCSSRRVGKHRLWPVQAFLEPYTIRHAFCPECYQSCSPPRLQLFVAVAHPDTSIERNEMARNEMKGRGARCTVKFAWRT